MIQLTNLNKIYNPNQNNEVRAVQNIDLQIESGEGLLIKGASGSGKTTLLALLACLSKPSSGTYHFENQAVSKWSEKFLTVFRQKNIGVVFQNFQLLKGFDVFTNISIPLLPLGFSNKEISQKVQKAAQEAHIEHRLSFPIKNLSGGELQRTAIARALVNSPKVLLADEPTASLDSEMALKILNLFEELKKEGKTIIVTSHDPAVEQHPLVGRVLTMKDGKIL